MSTRLPMRPWRTAIWAVIAIAALDSALLWSHGALATRALAGLADLAALFGVASLWFYRRGRQAVVFDDDAVTLPGWLLRPRPLTIRFADLREVRITRRGPQRYLRVVHAGGRRSINRSLAGDATFDEAARILLSRVTPAHQLPRAIAKNV